MKITLVLVKAFKLEEGRRQRGEGGSVTNCFESPHRVPSTRTRFQE